MLRYWTLLLLPVLSRAQTPGSYPCQAPEDTRAVIQEAIRAGAEGRQRLQALARQHPGNFWFQMAYLDSMKRPVAPDDLVEAYRERFQEDASSPFSAYLYAYALAGTDTAASIKILDDLTRRTPQFPQPWFRLAEIYGFPGFQDRAKMLSHAEAYLERCPETLEAAVLATRLDPSEKLRLFTRDLRERIAGKAHEDLFSLHRMLWRLELKLAPIPDHPQQRTRIAKDLEFLASLDRAQYPSLVDLLREGYTLTGDKASLQKLTAEAETPSEVRKAFFQAQSEWLKSNPYPSPADTSEKKEAFHRRRAAALEEWVRRLPNDEFVRLARLSSLAEIADTPQDVLQREGEAVLASADATSTAPSQVAEIWARRGVGLERIPTLVRVGREAYRNQQARVREDDYDLFGPAERNLMDEDALWRIDAAAWRTLIMAYSKAGRISDARIIAAMWNEGLHVRRKRAADIRSRRKASEAGPVAQAAGTSGTAQDMVKSLEERLLATLPASEAQYYEALAWIAVADQRKLDALSFYQAALRLTAGAPLAPQDPSKSEIGRNAADLWNELGGTSEGWQAWLDLVRFAPSAELHKEMLWTALRRELPEFSLRDRAGQTWTLAKLKGKVTLLNVWATWCGPCRVELPHLQKLQDQLRDRKDIQVVTLNVDENTELIEPFLRENNYTFPVLLANSFLASFAPSLAMPTNWISDGSGSLRLEAIGFSSNGEQWIADTMRQVEAVRDSPGR